MMDRIDIHVEVPHVDYEKVVGTALGETLASVRARVEAAEAVQ
jgi:magnesium chelatase family protein